MKKNIVIEIIADYFYQEGNRSPQDSKIIADKLLDELESVGMLPPFNSSLYADYELGSDTRNYCVWDKE